MLLDYQDLNPGCIYLTLGSSQEVLWLFKDYPAKFKTTVLYNPKSTDIRLAIESPNWLGTTEVVIIFLKSYVSTGLIKPNGTMKAEGDYAVPTDQFLSIPKDRYVFIIGSDFTGTVNADMKKNLKKLSGGLYNLLDLSNLDYGGGDSKAYKGFPFSAERTWNTQIEPEESREFNLVNNLTTIDGVMEWGNFKKAEIVKWFVTPGVKTSILLNTARASSLYPYLMPFLEIIKENRGIDNAAVLQNFAMWVYLSTRYYSDEYHKGLHIYTTKEGRKTFMFRPSSRAVEQYLNITTCKL